MPRSTIARLCGKCMFLYFLSFFKETVKLFPAWLYSLTFPPAICERSSFSAAWLPFHIITVYFRCSNRWVVILQHSLNLHFPNMWCWNIFFFMCISAIHISSLVACLFVFFAHFLNWIFWLFTVEFGEFFKVYSRYMLFLRYVVCKFFLLVFSLSLLSLLRILYIVKVLILLKSNLSFFCFVLDCAFEYHV